MVLGFVMKRLRLYSHKTKSTGFAHSKRASLMDEAEKLGAIDLSYGLCLMLRINRGQPISHTPLMQVNGNAN